MKPSSSLFSWVRKLQLFPRNFRDTPPERSCFLLTISGQCEAFLRNGALVTLASLRVTNPDIPVVILYENLSHDQRKLFSGYDLRQVDVNGFKRSAASVRGRPDLNSSIFLRFGVEDLTDYDFALLLDCDLVVLDDITNLFATPGELLARVMDDHPLSEQFQEGEKVLARERIPTDLYAFNAGVLGLDVRYWREVGLRNLVMGFASKYGWDAFSHCDQSVLNLIGYKFRRVTPISKIYNFAWWPDMQKRRHTLTTNSRGLTVPSTDEGLAKVVHWTGPIKPWQQRFHSLPPLEQRLFCLECYSQFAKS